MFDNHVCELGKYLNIVLNSDITYDAIQKYDSFSKHVKDVLEEYKNRRLT